MTTQAERVSDERPGHNLASLLERVKAAKGPDRFIDADLDEEFGDWTNLGGWWRRHKKTGVEERYTYTAAPAYTASIDAALTLVARMLPGWRVALYQMAGHWQASIAEIDAETDLALDDYFSDGPTATLAILTAALEALISKEPTHV